MADWQGSFTALVTPFHNGILDEQALERLLDYQLAGRSAGIIPCATTGEGPTISSEEFRRILELTLRKAKGKAAVLAYTKAVAKATKLPIMLYNVPSRTGVSLDPATVARLAEIDNIVAIKEASGSLDQASQIIGQCGDRFAVFSGDDSLTLPMLAVGARGVVSVVANVLPKDTAKLVACFLEGKVDEARKIHLKQFALVKALFAETSPGPVKCALNLLGLCHADLRMPLVDVSDGTRKMVKEELKRYGILK
ncbi:MAG: 4-hydroxy-tetrahydrodipicolinate synthase [Candidatus Edwardsbacteria bacterium]|nr:4-hydroxy-tetrahydrodipicolinate synthase [Candidatus Edwardsbacteria bacterium]